MPSASSCNRAIFSPSRLFYLKGNALFWLHDLLHRHRFNIESAHSAHAVVVVHCCLMRHHVGLADMSSIHRLRLMNTLLQVWEVEVDLSFLIIAVATMRLMFSAVLSLIVLGFLRLVNSNVREVGMDIAVARVSHCSQFS